MKTRSFRGWPLKDKLGSRLSYQVLSSFVYHVLPTKISTIVATGQNTACPTNYEL